jgi:formate hydrogenlyase subunit 4
MNWPALIPWGLGLVMAPLLPGLINRTKAWMAGRRGPPLIQLYLDLAKLLRKGAVYSRTTTWIFRAAPLVGLAAIATALALVPLGGRPGVVSLAGDVILLAGLLALARFATVLAALDTGSSFEGMGASREVQFGALAEPALFLSIAVLAARTGELELASILGNLAPADWISAAPSLALVGLALGIVLLAENSRIPVDDPSTHLELTMIHEVMVLDHGGPDLAFIFYAAALKLWLLSALVAGVMVPVHTGGAVLDALITVGAIGAVGVGVGIVESIMARLRLLLVPQLLVGAGALALVAMVLVLR